MREGGRGELILSEVSPVITLGKRAGEGSLVLPRKEYQRMGIEILQVNRGGLATYHGPGQWVAFLVESLEQLTGDRKGVRRAVDGLLNAALKTVIDFGVSAEIGTKEKVGVWSKKGKIASVGIAIENSVLLHGICLNCYATPKSFYGIRPCGLECVPDYLIDPNEKSPPSLNTVFEVIGEGLVGALVEEFPVISSP